MKIRQSMRHPSRTLLTVWLCIAFLAATQSMAQQPAEPQMPRAPTAPIIEGLNANSQPASPEQSIKAPEVAAGIEFNLRQANGQDNDTELRRDTGRAEIQLTLELEQQLSRAADLVSRLELNGQRFTEDTLNVSDEEFSYQLESLYFQLDASKQLRIRAGRFNLDDPMETIVDEDLDGLLVSFEQGPFELELSRTRKDVFEASTVGRRDQITNTMGSVQISPNDDSRWIPYVLHRSSEPFNSIRAAETTWYGLQGIIEPDSSPIRYWVHGSIQNGEETDETEKIDLGGYMLDIGINWNARGPLKPTYTLGIAHASGGSRADRFRQSGLQSNDFALNGKSSFRYLGEVMDPELTNIRIITLGFGAELSREWTLDVALHQYRQVETEDALRGSDIEFDPLGENVDLGQGADLVIAYQHDKQTELKATAGVFAPGRAFDDTRDEAWLVNLELSHEF